MPFDVLGCTRVTLTHATSFNPCPMGLGNLFKVRRDGDRTLQLLFLNEEFLVSASHQLALITSLPFVHTARRSYRLNGPVRTRDGGVFGWPKCQSSPCQNLFKPYHLEEGEVVTRFPSIIR
jgi:hypothetical protein